MPENAAGGGRVSLEVGPATEPPGRPRDLAALLAKALVHRTLAYEATNPLALSYAANPVRALGAGPVAVRDLPRLTGVGKETLAVMTTWLTKQGLAQVTGAGTGRTVVLTTDGRAAYEQYVRAPEVEDDALRRALEPITDALDLTAPPDCWRARLPRPDTLPHHPVISHRGGHPDGS